MGQQRKPQEISPGSTLPDASEYALGAKLREPAEKNRNRYQKNGSSVNLSANSLSTHRMSLCAVEPYPKLSFLVLVLDGGSAANVGEGFRVGITANSILDVGPTAAVCTSDDWMYPKLLC